LSSVYARKPLSVGIVGAGDIARKVHLPVLLSMPQVRVSWVYDSRVERARAVSRAYGLDPLGSCPPAELPPCDVVLLAIPVGARASYLSAYERGPTAVFAEKPFATSANEHRGLIGAFEPHRLGCAYMRRFYASTLTLRELVRTAPFGALRRIQVSEGNRTAASRVDSSYFDDARQTGHGGILSELGCHSLDVALFVSGAHTFRVAGCDLVMDAATDRKITAQVQLLESSYLPAEGVCLDVCVSWLDRQLNRMTFEFDHATVWIETHPASEVHLAGTSHPGTEFLLRSALEGARTSNQAFFLQWQSFLDGVRAGQESQVSARSALLSTELIEALYGHGRGHA
jgi:predicted dehydrogenase